MNAITCALAHDWEWEATASAQGETTQFFSCKRCPLKKAVTTSYYHAQQETKTDQQKLADLVESERLSDGAKL